MVFLTCCCQLFLGTRLLCFWKFCLWQQVFWQWYTSSMETLPIKPNKQIVVVMVVLCGDIILWFRGLVLLFVCCYFMLVFFVGGTGVTCALFPKQVGWAQWADRLACCRVDPKPQQNLALLLQALILVGMACLQTFKFILPQFSMMDILTMLLLFLDILWTGHSRGINNPKGY